MTNQKRNSDLNSEHVIIVKFRRLLIRRHHAGKPVVVSQSVARFLRLILIWVTGRFEVITRIGISMDLQLYISQDFTDTISIARTVTC